MLVDWVVSTLNPFVSGIPDSVHDNYRTHDLRSKSEESYFC